MAYAGTTVKALVAKIKNYGRIFPQTPDSSFDVYDSLYCAGYHRIAEIARFPDAGY